MTPLAEMAASPLAWSRSEGLNANAVRLLPPPSDQGRIDPDQSIKCCPVPGGSTWPSSSAWPVQPKMLAACGLPAGDPGSTRPEQRDGRVQRFAPALFAGCKTWLASCPEATPWLVWKGCRAGSDRVATKGQVGSGLEEGEEEFVT